MSNIHISGVNKVQSIPIPKAFIEKFLPNADGSFVKVFLYGLFLCLSDNTNDLNKTIAEDLNLLESDVIRAWKYWDSKGIIKFKIDSNNDINLEFLDLANIEVEDKNSSIHVETRPSYHNNEIVQNMKNNRTLKQLYKYYEQKSGKPLNQSDISIIYSFYDWLKLPGEVIMILFEYCFSKHKTSLRYMEKVAINWVDNGLITVEKVEKYINEQEKRLSQIYQIKKAFGIYDRKLTKKETDFIEKWIFEYSFSIDLISYAYDITISNIGKLSFPYINSIITSWNKKGITEIADAEQDLNNFKSSKQKEFETSNAKNKQKDKKFSKINKRDYDFSEIKRLAKERNYFKG